VAGRNSDNTFIKKVLQWEPSTAFRVGLEKTYRWIEKQYTDRAAGLHTVS
jgi:nucleoside-diphosphate-sugar epimerase